MPELPGVETSRWNRATFSRKYNSYAVVRNITLPVSEQIKLIR